MWAKVVRLAEVAMRILGVASLGLLTWALAKWAGLEGLLVFGLVLGGILSLVAVPFAILCLLGALLNWLFKSRQHSKTSSSIENEVIKPFDTLLAPSDGGNTSKTWRLSALGGWGAFSLQLRKVLESWRLFRVRLRLATLLGLFSLGVWSVAAWMAPCGLEQKILGLAFGVGLMFLIWLGCWLIFRGNRAADSQFETVSFLDVAGLVFATGLVFVAMISLYLMVSFALVSAIYGNPENLKSPPAFLHILTLVFLLGGATALSCVQSYLGFRLPHPPRDRRPKADNPWSAIPDPSGSYWARESDLDKVGLFFIQAIPPTIIILGSAYIFGFFK